MIQKFKFRNMLQETISQENPWTKTAKDYKTYDKVTAAFASTLIDESLLDAMNPGASKTVLDVACGTGVVAMALAERLEERDASLILATDASVGMAQETLLNVKARGLEDLVKVYVMDGQSLDLDDDSIDHVFCQFGLMFFADPAQGLKEMARVTKPKTGSITIASYKCIPTLDIMISAMRSVTKQKSSITDPFTILPHIGSPFRLGSLETMQELAAQAGLSIVKCVERPLSQSINLDFMAHFRTNPVFEDLFQVYEIPPEDEEKVFDQIVKSVNEAYHNPQDSDQLEINIDCLVTVLTKP